MRTMQRSPLFPWLAIFLALAAQASSSFVPPSQPLALKSTSTSTSASMGHFPRHQTFSRSPTASSTLFLTVIKNRSARSTSLRPNVVALRGGSSSSSSTNSGTEIGPFEQDFSKTASELFGQIRIPAALFAGASAGAAFAMPLLPNEGIKVGLVKRVYSLAMMGALSSELIAIVVSTVTMASLSSTESKQAPTVAMYLTKYYEFEWVTARLHFLSGLILFVLASGLRAWVTIGCPIIAKAALGTIVSSTLLALAFVNTVERREFSKGLPELPLRFVSLLIRRMRNGSNTADDGFNASRPWFVTAAGSGLVTLLYVLFNFIHVYKHLASGM